MVTAAAAAAWITKLKSARSPLRSFLKKAHRESGAPFFVVVAAARCPLLNFALVGVGGRLRDWMVTNLVEQVRRAGVVGAGGGGFPTAVNLAAKADTVIAAAGMLVNAAVIARPHPDVYREVI